ncbi:MAG: 50S ribosomal protein L22 [Patescibacteria group bacterium]|nr:50S ribosomal protein L22 [Patescibacteria group bacterium]
MEKSVKQSDQAMAKTKATTKSKISVKPGKNDITEVKASARFIHIAPKKVRLVIENIKKMGAEQAVDYLRFVNRSASLPVTKLLKSAIANAENNFQLDKKDLFIKNITADGGPVLKRYRPRAHGSSAAILKRTSHINLILGVKAGAVRKEKKDDKKTDEKVKIVSPDEIKKAGPRSSSSDGDLQGKENKGFLKGVFQRKTG